MKTKILVLASSKKNDGRCIAGRQWLDGTVDPPQLGGWIRPLGEKNQGAIENHKAKLHWDHRGSNLPSSQKGRFVKPGDLVEIDLEDHGSQDFQCENRKMKSGKWINLVEEIPLIEPLFGAVEDDPSALWLPSRANGLKSDRVPVTQLSEHSTPRRSLFCIQPENLQFHEPYGKVRAKFRFKNQDYDLRITDLDFKPDEFDQSDLESCRLVISLGMPFSVRGVEYHFKLVAAVLCPSIVMTD
jgi:hypothetical protein